MKTTLVLADDHPLLLEGTRSFLANNGHQILAMATDGNQAYNEILKHQPNIAILDFDMPKLNGLEVAQLCQQNTIAVKIIILTLYKQEAISKEIGQTIQGYLVKEDALSELEVCISEIMKGKTYLSESLYEQIHLPDSNDFTENLSATELKILKYLAKDCSSSVIAESLFISKRTVEKHRSNIIKKLGIKSSQNALLLWVKNHPELFNT